MWQVSVPLLALVVPQAAGHGWVTVPMSKNELVGKRRSNWINGMPERLRYEPQSASGTGSCGVPQDPGSSSDYNFGLNKWQKWYDAGNEAVPEITPGGDFFVRQAFTAQHHGQGWMQVQCLPEATDTWGEGHFPEAAGWLNLERSQSDRTHGYLPSNPEIYAWYGGTRDVWYHVPSNFSCQHTQNRVIGRWVWKTGNSCNDMDNKKGFGLTTFKREEMLAAGGTTLGQCAAAPEVFISCIDFMLKPGGPAPAPTTASPTSAPTTAPAPAPTTAPAPPTTAPAPAPSCCKWASNCGGNCATGWCSQSQSDCSGCQGFWCAPTLLSDVKPHEA